METKRERYRKLSAALKKERDSSWRTHWTDLADHMLPRRVRWNNSADRNKGDKRNQNIIDSTATLALRTLRSGMMSGITSPARQWFRLTVPDPDLAEHGPVKEWLNIVTRRMLEVFLKGNYYKMLSGVYGDIGCFGTSCAILEEDEKDILRGYTFPIGSYMLATSDRSVVDTMIREYSMTVRNVVKRFGDKKASPDKRWKPFSMTVRNAWDQGNYEQVIDITHVINPNMEWEPKYLEAKYKPWASCYFETGSGDDQKFLRESGYDEFPVVAPRWDLASPDDVYGAPCPGMDALGDVRALQVLQKRKAEAIQKMVRPPLTAPTSLRSRKVSILPGDVTHVDEREGQKGVRPIFEVKPDIQGLVMDIQEHQSRIKRAFYEDLFLMLSMDPRATPPTAEEIRARHEEKLLMLGPVLEHLNDELLDPAIDRNFNIMLRRGMIPTPPEEIQGENLKVEYISIMHQAQKLVSAGAIDGFLSRVGNMAQFKPDVLDKVDMDQTVDEYGDIYGVPPKIIVPDENVIQLREQRAQAQAMQQKIAMAEQASKAGKNLSETDTDNKNALTDLQRQVTG